MIPAGWEGREHWGIGPVRGDLNEAPRPNPHSGMWRASIRRVFHVKHLVAC